MPTELAILPLRDTILFPHAILPLAVARESSVALVHEAVRERWVIGTVTQRDPAIADPLESDLYEIGTQAHIRTMFKLRHGVELRLVVQGINRFRVLQVTQYRPFIQARIQLIERVVPPAQEIETRAVAQSVLGLFQRVVELSPTLSDELSALAANIQEPARLADFIAASLTSLKTAERQEILEFLDVRTRLNRVQKILLGDVRRNQRRHYLRALTNALQTVTRSIFGRVRGRTVHGKCAEIVRLLRDPRTPVGIAMTVVSRLNPRDMKAVAVDQNVPEAIRKTARSFIKEP